MTAHHTFDPGKYLTTLKGKSYLEVKWRLLWLRTEHPDAVIETTLEHLDLPGQTAVFRAKASIPMIAKAADGQALCGRDGQPVIMWASATGWGMEDMASLRESRSSVTDWLEKGETKSIGRALAALGYGTQFTTDFDFDHDGARVVDSPVERTTSPVRQATAPATAPEPRMVPQRAAPPERAAAPSGARAPLDRAPHEPGKGPVLPATEPQVKAIYAIARGARMMDAAEVEARCTELYGVTPAGLSRRQASELIDALKTGPAGPAPTIHPMPDEPDMESEDSLAGPGELRLPHSDAEPVTYNGVQERNGGRLLWRVGRVVCVEIEVQGKPALISTEHCPHHDVAWLLGATQDPTAWFHGSKADRCWRRDVISDDGEVSA